MLVMVTGALSRNDNPSSVRTFVQSFVLAPQENGFYVLNDIFRYTSVRGGGASFDPPQLVKAPSFSSFVIAKKGKT